MKTILQSSLIVCITIIIFATGCRKDETFEPTPTLSNNDPTNLLNPYDGFGYWHNIILDSIEQYRIAGTSVDFEKSCAFIRKFYKMKNWPTLPNRQFDNVPQTVDAAATNIYGLIDRSQWSDSAKAKISQLVIEMEALSIDSCTYPKLKTAISHFEDEILRSGLRETDKEAVLKVASIARHSSYRWLQRNDWQAPYRNNTLQSTRFLKKLGKWFVVTLCDIGGAVADLSIASGAEASDYMSHIMDLTQ